MAQRVLIAGAISCEPDLIIADEPTTALDVTVQADVLDLIRDLQQRLNIGVILVTHNFGVVADLCDRVVVMQNGRLVEEGTVREHPPEPARAVHPDPARVHARRQGTHDHARLINRPGGGIRLSRASAPLQRPDSREVPAPAWRTSSWSTPARGSGPSRSVP